MSESKSGWRLLDLARRCTPAGFLDFFPTNARPDSAANRTVSKLLRAFALAPDTLPRVATQLQITHTPRSSFKYLLTVPASGPVKSFCSDVRCHDIFGINVVSHTNHTYKTIREQTLGDNQVVQIERRRGLPLYGRRDNTLNPPINTNLTLTFSTRHNVQFVCSVKR